jgi:amino acid transporter
MGNSGAALIALGALVSVYGYLSAKLLGMPRVTFALAEQGDLPHWFANVSRRFHTPWSSILVYATVIWGLALAGNFKWNVTLSVVARLFYFAVVCGVLIALRRRQPAAPRLQVPGGPVLAAMGIMIAIALTIHTLTTQADRGKWLIVVAAFAGAFLNWAWARHADRVKV